MKSNSVSPAVKKLDELSNQFQFRDWDYTRTTNLKEIRYLKEHDPQNKLGFRLKEAAFWLFAPTPEWIKLAGRKHGLVERFHMAKHCLQRDPNLPDGILDSGNIITFWEETGNYLSLMQPTVGALLAKFLMEEPEHPHAKSIIQELERLDRRYTKRRNSGEVSGVPSVVK